MTYQDQIKDPRWQKKRLEILNRDEFVCQGCFDDESELHVHHRTYHKGHMIGEYENEELMTLCKTCHQDIYKAKEEVVKLIDMVFIDPDTIDEFRKLLISIIKKGRSSIHYLRDARIYIESI